MAKKNSQDYTQVCFYIRKTLATKFKSLCTGKDLEYSEVAEELISKWVLEQENEEKQK